MWGKSLLSATALTAAVMVMGGPTATLVHAQEVEGIRSLRGERPNLPNLNGIVASRTHLKILGKALFWDERGGSDGMACASCHFHGGADIRTRNQFNPGGATADDEPPFPFNNGHAVNQEATNAQFPFFVPGSDPRDAALVVRDDDDRFASSGTFNGAFQKLRRNGRTESCDINALHPNFQLGGRATRKVEPRHTPTVINAVFNFRNFWDGRANNIFNGVDPFGQRTNQAGLGGVLKLNGAALTVEQLALRNSSLASQAVGPPLSSFEMSCDGKEFAAIGRKLLAQQPLKFQDIDLADSVFGRSGLVVSGQQGLSTTYEELVQLAFDRRYWEAPGRHTINRAGGTVAQDPSGFRQIEHNWSMFWGLALQEYQASLISDRTDFDNNRLTASERRGQDVFENQGKCVACHKGPLFTGAAITTRDNNVLIEGMLLASETGNAFKALYDDAFYNIGVSPTIEDIGLGGVDPHLQKPLSFTRQWKANNPNEIVDKINLGNNGENVNPAEFEFPNDPELARSPNSRDAVDGAFKTPTLRNVGTTPPYMHDGSIATLDDVIEFYDRGGNRLSKNLPAQFNGFQNTTGGGPGGFNNNLDADIADVSLGLSAQQKRDLKNFMLALSDDRVLCHKAPFDHPSLSLKQGHRNQAAPPATEPPLDRARDIVKTLPAVGSRGYTTCFGNDGKLFGNVRRTFRTITR